MDYVLELFVFAEEVGGKETFPCMVVSEHGFEVAEHEEGDVDGGFGVEDAGFRGHLGTHQRLAEANCQVVGIHLVLVLPHHHFLAQKLQQKHET